MYTFKDVLHDAIEEPFLDEWFNNELPKKSFTEGIA